MTFYLGLARVDHAILACDTRYYLPLTGTRRDLPDAHKFAQLAGGWATGSGYGHWLQDVYAACRTIPAADAARIGETIRALHTPTRRKLEGLPGYREARAHAEDDRLGDLVVAHRTAAGYVLDCYDDQGTWRRAPGVVWNTMREGERDLVVRHVQTWPAARPSWETLLRQVGHLWAELAARCGPDGSMSAELGLIFLLPEGDLALAPMSVRFLLGVVGRGEVPGLPRTLTADGGGDRTA